MIKKRATFKYFLKNSAIYRYFEVWINTTSDQRNSDKASQAPWDIGDPKQHSSTNHYPEQESSQSKLKDT